MGQDGCTGVKLDIEKCSARQECPRWENWNQWTPCTITCLGGTRNRSRKCKRFSVHQKCTADYQLDSEGKNVTVMSKEDGICGTGPCPYWAEWDDWQGCPETCGGAQELRERGCINGDVGQLGCSNIRPEEADLQRKISAELGTVSMSHQFGENAFMSGGKASKFGSFHRQSQEVTTTTTEAPATTPYTANEEWRACAFDACPGEEPPGAWQPWSGWYNWSPCNVTCAGGTMLRSRDCQAFTSDPQDWQKQIEDTNMCRPVDKKEVKVCNTQPCPFFAEWTEWGECNGPVCLERGKQIMKRECLHGEIGNDGCPQSTENYRERDCIYKKCPHYAEWWPWSTCSKSCSGGIHVRKRICNYGEVGDSGCPESQDFERGTCEGVG